MTHNNLIESELIAERLERLSAHLKNLKALLKAGKKKACKDPIACAALERFFQLGLEGVLDVGNHIIVELDLRKPSTYENILPILAEHKVINKKQLSGAKSFAALRSLLVHDHEPLDREDTFEKARKSLPVIEEIIVAYKKTVSAN